MNSLNYNTTEIRRLVVCVCVSVCLLVPLLRFCKALGSLIPNYPAGKASKSMKRLNWNCQSGAVYHVIKSCDTLLHIRAWNPSFSTVCSTI